MTQTIFERYTTQAYQDFLNRLEAVESKLVSARIDFDPTLTFTQMDNAVLSEQARHAWCLCRIISLLRTIIKGPSHALENKSFFPKMLFYRRLEEALPELEECFKLLKQLGTREIDNRDTFLLGVLVWELLQSLNPLICRESKELWDNLHRRSLYWQSGFTTMPRQLHSKLRTYFHARTDAHKIDLLQEIRTCVFHDYLRTDVTPEMIRNALNTLQFNANAELQHTVSTPISMNLNNDILTAEHKKRLDTLDFLHAQLESYDNPISANLLAQHLNSAMFNILDCFDSPVSEPNTYSYLTPADKLKFIFDAIVFRTNDAVSSEVALVASGVFQALAPKWLTTTASTYLVSASPGTTYIRTKFPNYQPIDLNPYLYDSVTDPGTKKKLYQQNARSMIADLKQRLDKTLVYQQSLKTLVGNVRACQAAKILYVHQILSLIALLATRVEHIVQYQDCSESVSQFEIAYRNYFGDTALDARSQLIISQIGRLIPLSDSEINRNSVLAGDLRCVNQQIMDLQGQNELLNVTQKFSELLAATQRYETQYHEEQARFTFPEPNATWRKNFPYYTMLAFLLGAISLVISIGILIGNPYLTLLVLPVLVNYTVPVCVLAGSVGSTVLLKSGIDLIRYGFFYSSPESQIASSTSSVASFSL